MATKEQIDKRVATRQAQLDVQKPKLEVLNEKVAKFDERMAELRKKLTERRDRTAKKVALLSREIEWFKAAPVNGVEEPEPDESADENAVETDEDTDENAVETDDEPGEASDLPDENDGDESDESAPAVVRGPGGKFVSANA
jgi:hypothetical protein